MIRANITVSLAMMSLAFPVAAAPVDTTDLARCHALPTRDQQLDCYEALATAALSGARAGAPTAHTAAGSTPPTTSAPGTAPASGATSAPEATSTPGVQRGAPETVPFNPDDPTNFGLNRRQAEPHPSPEAVSAVKSVVSLMTEDRQHNITVVLENGQTWHFIEPEPRLRPGDSVTIKRASLGSFLMSTPSRRSYRVERLK